MTFKYGEKARFPGTGLKIATKTALAAIVTLGACIGLLGGCASLKFSPYDTSGSRIALPVALVNMETSADSSINRTTMISYVERIVSEHPDVRLINFGEASLGYYSRAVSPAAYQRSVAEPIDGPTVTALRMLASKFGVYLSFGFVESEAGKIFDSGLIIDDGGNIVAHRHKSDFVIFDHLDGFTPGQKTVSTASIDGIKVAFLICNDFNNRDYQAALKADGDTRILILPQASAGLKPDFVRTQAQPYPGKWFLSAQRFGLEDGSRYYGSWIIDPNGYMVSSAKSAGYLYYSLAIK